MQTLPPLPPGYAYGCNKKKRLFKAENFIVKNSNIFKRYTSYQMLNIIDMFENKLGKFSTISIDWKILENNKETRKELTEFIRIFKK